MATSAVKCALKNGVAVLHITYRRALGGVAGLVAGVEHAIGASATGLVVAVAGRRSRPAPTSRFSKPHVPPSFAEVMAAFEDAPFPAAAIHGTALGGGFEPLWPVTVARASGRASATEVHLGLLPGAGGAAAAAARRRRRGADMLTGADRRGGRSPSAPSTSSRSRPASRPASGS